MGNEAILGPIGCKPPSKEKLGPILFAMHGFNSEPRPWRKEGERERTHFTATFVTKVGLMQVTGLIKVLK